MLSELKLVAGLLARRRGAAIPFATTRQVAIQPHAMILTAIAMAGEDTTIHALMVSRIDEASHYDFVVDPRFRDDQYMMFRRFSDYVEDYFTFCRRNQTYPQLWVSSAAGIAHLDVLADRLRYNRDDPRVRRMGERLSYWTERAPIAGQQCLCSAAESLRQHYATGQQESEDAHLGALLAWIDPPHAGRAAVAAQAAEQIPMGVKTDPNFDKKILAPLVQKANAARRQGDIETLDGLAAQIGDALRPVVERIHHGTRRAIELLSDFPAPNLPALDEMEDAERYAFRSFMRSRDDGYHLTLRDRPKAAAFRLTKREAAVENYEASLLLGDGVVRAAGLLEGRVVRGVVENPDRVRLRPRVFEQRFDLVSDQPVLRARPRDVLNLCDDPRVAFEVLSIRRTGAQTRLRLRVDRGKRSFDVFAAEAETLEIASAKPDWGRIGRVLNQLSGRLGVTPWTHDPDQAPLVEPAITPPEDPLSELEDLR